MSDITYTRITPNGEERCEMLTTEEKLAYIKRYCWDNACYGGCKLEPEKTCPTKLWADWTDEEINTAYDILTAKDSLPNGEGMTIEEKAKAIEEYCEARSCDGDCPLDTDDAHTCYTLYESFPDEVELNYEILVKSGLIKPPVNFVKANPEDAVESEGDAVESDAVHSPTHYCKGGIECIEAIRASMTADGFCDYCKGNIIKYLWRWRDKGGIEDLRKARVYLDWLIEEAAK